MSNWLKATKQNLFQEQQQTLAVTTENDVSLEQPLPSTSEATSENNGAQKKYQSKRAADYLFRCMTSLGMNTPEKFVVLYRIYAVVALGLFGIWLPLAFTISYFQLDTSNLVIGNLLTSVQVTFNAFGGNVKLLIVYLALKKLRASEKKMDELDERCKFPEEIELLRKVIIQGNSFTLGLGAVYITYSTTTFFGSVYHGRAPYSLYNPFVNWRNSKSEFIWATIFEYFLMNGMCISHIIGDAYAPIYVCIVRCHIRALHIRVQRLTTTTDRTLEQNYDELKLCIKDHKMVLSLFNMISPIISLSIFWQFLLTAIMLSITLINIMIYAVDDAARLSSFFFICSVVVEVFPLCYHAQRLLDDCDRMATGIFHCNWENQDMRFRKLLIVFMQYTQRPLELLAGKMILINLNTFVSIAKFSFTLYSLINKMGLK